MKFKIILSSFLIILKLALFIYPAIIITLVILDPQLRTNGQSKFVPMWFETTTNKYNSWAREYLDTRHATTLNSSLVAQTEWPMFGSMFFLLTAEELQSQQKIDIKQKNISQAISNAINIITSPDTATWVKKKWKYSYFKTGKSYLEKENVFYRMLLIMGIASYEKITFNKEHHYLLEQQAQSLFTELLNAPFHLGDDYPNQCYPVDVLMAIGAIKKATEVGVDVDINVLSKAFMHMINDKTSQKIQLPPFQMNAKTAEILQSPRGCGTSGMFPFVPMLDINMSKQWYKTYTKHFWKETPYMVGFREFPKGYSSFMDVDSGPVIFDIGSVASLFGIGASKSVGQLNHTVPLTIETIAYAWPTPFGFLIPSVAGKLAVNSWSLGEVALLFSMTRPIYADNIIAFNGSIPLSVWGILFIFFILGTGFIFLEIRYIRNTLNKHKKKE